MLQVGNGSGPGPAERVPWRTLCDAYFRDFAPIVRQAAHNVLRSDEDADDVVGRVFARLMEAGDGIRARTRGPRYFSRAGRNEALKLMKESERRRVKKGLEPSLLPDPCRNQLDEAEVAEVKARVREAIQALPDRCAEVAWMSWVEERSRREIARELGIRVGGVERHRQRARRALRQRLGRFYGALREVGGGGGGGVSGLHG